MVVLLIAPLMKLARLFFFALVALLSSLSFAQYPQVWSAFRNLRLPSTEKATTLMNAPGGGFYMYGDTGTGSQVVAKLDATGAMLWSRAEPGAARNAAAGPGGVAIVGIVQPFPASLSVAKIDPSGSPLWARIIKPATTGQNPILAVDASGNVVMGLMIGSALHIQKLSAATGATLFDATYAGVAGPQLRGLRVDPSGSTYIGGVYSGITGSFAAKYDANGNQLWSKALPGPSYNVLFLVDGSGNSYEAQLTKINSAFALQVTKLDTNGNVVWNPNTSYEGSLAALAISPAGNLVVATSGLNFYKFSAAGSYVGTVPVPNYNIDSEGIGHMVVDAGENIYVASSSSGAGNLLKLDSTGALVWHDDEVGSASAGYGLGRSVVIDPAGHPVALFTVLNTLPTDADFRVAALDTAGNKQWDYDFDTGRAANQTVGSVTDTGGNSYAATSSKLSNGATASRYGIVKINSAGTVLWNHGIADIGGNERQLLPPQLAPNGVVLVQRSYDLWHSRVYRYDANGNLLWTFNTVTNTQLVENYVVGPDGSVYLGLSYGYLLRIEKLNPNGTIAWIADKPIGDVIFDEAQTLVLDGSGNVYVRFFSEPGPDFNQPGLARFNSNGTFAWQVTVGSSSFYIPSNALALDSSGQPLVVSQEPDDENPGGVDYWLSKYDAGGNVIWSQPMLSGQLQPSVFGPFVVDALGNSFAMGSRAAGDSNEFVVEKFDPNGASQWISPVGVSSNTFFLGLLPDDLGGVMVGADTFDPNTGTNYGVFRFSPAGTLVWPMSGGSFSNGALIYDSIGLTNNVASFSKDAVGNLFVGGTAFGPDGMQDINVVKYVRSDSAFVAQSIPSSMVAGQTYQVSVTFKNTGFENWTAVAGYRLVLISPSTWGIGSVALGNAETIVPGQSKTFSFGVAAPTLAGTYPLQCKMYRNGLGSFGSLTVAASVTVAVQGNAARNLSITFPATVKAGTKFSVSVDMRNVGTNTWTQSDSYVLSAVPGFSSWGAGLVQLLPADSIASGGHKVFTFQCTAPSTPGSYTMNWQMRQAAVFFGNQTGARTISVTP